MGSTWCRTAHCGENVTKATKNNEKKFMKNLVGKKKVSTFALAFGKQASFQRRKSQGERSGRAWLSRRTNREAKRQKTEAKNKIAKKWRKICRFQIFFLPLQSFSATRKPQGERDGKSPENIERLTIDKDKKVQELINELSWKIDNVSSWNDPPWAIKERYPGWDGEVAVMFTYREKRKQDNNNEEFDPGSGWTLATGLTHASRGAAGMKLASSAGDRRTGE